MLANMNLQPPQQEQINNGPQCSAYLNYDHSDSDYRWGINLCLPELGTI